METKEEVLGYECLDCDFNSDLSKDWNITETDVKCGCCGSTSVIPMNIDKGVRLK